LFTACESKLYQPTATEGLNPTTVSEGARSRDIGSIQGHIELGEQAKVVRMLTGVGKMVANRGECTFDENQDVSPGKGPLYWRVFFACDLARDALRPGLTKS